MPIALTFHYNSDGEAPAAVAADPSTYILANAPNPASSLMLFINGLLQGSGYALTGSKIKFSNAPARDDDIRAFYRY